MKNMRKSHMTTDELLAGLGCFGSIIGYILLIFAVLVAVPTLVWLLWGWIAVPLFGAPALTWIEAIGLYLLVRLLFGESILTFTWGKK